MNSDCTLGRVNEAEEWRPVIGYEGYYSVSTLGNVRSEPRTVPHRSSGTVNLRGRMLNPALESWGYRQARFCRNGIGVLRLVHRLVVEAFIGPIPKGKEVNHKNGVKTDNRLCNLEVVTPKENIHHAHASGLTSNRGDTHRMAKLCRESVAEIRRRAGETTQAALANEYGVSPSTISRVLSGDVWREYPAPIADASRVESAASPSSGAPRLV